MNETGSDTNQCDVIIVETVPDGAANDGDDQMDVQFDIEKIPETIEEDDKINTENISPQLPNDLSGTSNCLKNDMDSTMKESVTQSSNESKESINKDQFIEDTPESSDVQFETVDTVNENMDKEIMSMKDFNENIEADQSENMESISESSANENHYFSSSCIELARRHFKSDVNVQHYTKGCLWSPDGTCLLLPVHLDGMHVIELPAGFYELQKVKPKRPVSELVSAVHVPEGGTVYDCSWYPRMHSSYPETCCWLASRQHEPIHLWDAYTGELRCTYRGYDDVDEIETAISVAFSNDGQRVFGGYRKTIRIFDTSIPGRDCDNIKVRQAISCFAQRSDSDDMITTGTWSGHIHHFDTRAPHLGSLFTLNGHTGGITWLKYSWYGNNWNLYSGARKDNRILQWDMRNYHKPVREFKRAVATNQRIYFDITPNCQWMTSGSTDGLLHVWDMSGKTPDIELPLHNDCCNGANFHPAQPILATSSGQYHFTNTEQTDEFPPTEQKDEQNFEYENAVILLWIGETEED